MTKQNEVNEEAKNEVANVENYGVSKRQIAQGNEEYEIFQNEQGKFERKAKFHEYNSFQPKDRAEQVWLMNVLDGDEETGNGLKKHVGAKITVEHVITRKYDKVNEDTGFLEYGVLTYLITPEREVYVTSSKTVYFTITRIMKMFGTPDSEAWENIIVEVKSQAGDKGDMLKIKMIG